MTIQLCSFVSISNRRPLSLTAIIWSLQPGSRKDERKHRELLTSLPKQIRAFCQKMAFDTEAVTAALADLEGEYQSILANNPSDPCDFDPLEVDESMVPLGVEALGKDSQNGIFNQKIERSVSTEFKNDCNKWFQTLKLPISVDCSLDEFRRYLSCN